MGTGEAVNFNNDGNHFNIFLSSAGDLEFWANGDGDGTGDRRMVIHNESGEVTVGGDGRTGLLQFKNAVGVNTIFVGESDGEAHVTLGGEPSGLSGRVQLHDSAGRTTIDLDATGGFLTLGVDGVDGDLSIRNSAQHEVFRVDGDATLLRVSDSSGVKRVELVGDDAALTLRDGSSAVTVALDGTVAKLTLGAVGNAGDVFVLDDTAATTIRCSGQTGNIDAVTVNGKVFLESSDARLKIDITPLRAALDSVLALRGVRFRRAQAGTREEIGFVGQEVEGVCPELVCTDERGYRSVSYSRMTAVLVEAVKEQQQLIREQAAALGAALGRIAALEAGPQA